MDLKEYIQILKKNFKLFLLIILVVIIGSFIYFHQQSKAHNVSLILNISRLGSQETDNYKYDDFYRLQADEKFAETVVEWLKSPRVVEDIYTKAGIKTENYTLKQLAKSIKSEKRSSQVIMINFSSPSTEIAQKTADSVVEVIHKNTQDLNKDQKENTWFEVISQDPVIRKNSYDWKMVFLGSMVGGMFLGFWIIMVKHYLK